jgi:hypothetical protein
MSDDMLYVALAILCTKKIGRRQIANYVEVDETLYTETKCSLSHKSTTRICLSVIRTPRFLSQSEYSSTNIHVAYILVFQ